MAKGEKMFSSAGMDVKKHSFEPPKPGEYEAKLRSEKAEIRKKQEPGSFPRVAVAFELLDTAENGGKNKWVFHDFYVRAEPNDRGNVLVAMSHQIVAFAKALGTVVKVPLMSINGEDCLDPKALVAWLKNRDGEVVKLKTKNEKDQQGNLRGRVDQFIESDEGADEDDEDHDEEDLDADDLEEDDEEPAPKAKKKKSKR
jgi:hypothetical protein